MSCNNVIVRRLYTEELKPAPGKAPITTEVRHRGNKGMPGVSRTVPSKRRTIRWIKIIAAFLAITFFIAMSIYVWNHLSTTRTTVEARRADIKCELRRRENLIPNLVYAVSKYAVYEQSVFRYVSDARDALKMIQSSQTPRVQANSMLEKTLSGLVALAEEYPDLKATQPIQDLIKEETNTEDRIAEAKKAYNTASEIHNRLRRIFPVRTYALIYGFKVCPYAGLEEDMKVPALNLDMTGRGEDIEEGVRVSVSDPGVTKPGEDRQEYR